MNNIFQTNDVGPEFAAKTARNANIALAAFHFLMMLLFLHYDVLPLFYANILSVFTYIIGFILIRNMHLTGYLYLCYIEICAYMCLATICLGVQYGFQARSSHFLFKPAFINMYHRIYDSCHMVFCYRTFVYNK